ncbi:enoyl-CoA hydratase/isomerase family protein [Mycobacterium shinjukuense]|uniref:Enoyl-CoA hydratase n=1 Tax=Mycobacterium shinjukuense TaxID=398694 RepID=A0A7I7MMG2_9MYCO|nr:enoyl-CoA hydratase-related protein [Mycobacterium shinjukuense]MCV6984747.1 enoyl-CoA hydratase/isomerase family protein [Mycobacterium shinjukuense]ORB67476.1 enoyl-CoA hydratase [Mycobacterium shinjukuense]BBX73356.1 enoyl-CoA hydratase [Mycobacterium shinjukuense]
MPYVDVDALTSVAGLSVGLAGGVLSVTLDRPESLNSLTVPLLTAIADALEDAATDPRVKVVRLDGKGRGFCSGASMIVDDWHGVGPAINLTEQANRAVRAITMLPQPVVAVVQGPAAGLGVSLALACDLVLASEDAFFTLAATKMGLVPDGGLSATLAAAAGRARAMRLALLNERLPAAEALAWGLISAVHPPADLEGEVDKVIQALLSGPAAAFAKAKYAINAATLTQLGPAFEHEVQEQTVLLRSDDFVEAAAAFRQRRPAAFSC